MPDPIPLITHKIIFLNGPPRSGKDTIAQYMMTKLPNVRHRKFSTRLKQAAKEMFNLSPELYKDLELSGNNALKDEPLPELLGKSWRQALISLSEDYMKPTYGKDVFGQLLQIELMRRAPGPFTVISDSGFDYEAVPIIEYFGPRNCFLWRLHRPGCDFSKDSRSHWSTLGSAKQITEIDLLNEHELDMFKAQINYYTKMTVGIDLKEV